MANSDELEKKIRFLDRKISQGEVLLKKLLYISMAVILLIIVGILIAIFFEDIFIIIGIALAVVGTLILIFILKNLNDLKKGLGEYMQRRNELSVKK